MTLDNEKRIMLAFALSFVALLLYRVMLPPPPKPPAKPAAPATAPGRPAAAASQAAPATAPAPPVPVALPVVQGSKAEEIVVENNFYRVTFSTEGAVVKSWILKKYVDEKGQPLDVVNATACQTLGFPLSVSLGDEELKAKVNAALYAAQPSSPTLTPPARLEFVYSDGKTQVRKQFSFEKAYEAHVTVSVTDGRRELPVEVAWPGGFGDHSLPAARENTVEQAVYQTADSTKVKLVGLSSSWLGRLFSGGNGSAQNGLQEDVSGPLAFAGLEDRYFAGIFLPDSPDVKLQVRRETWTPPDWKGEEKNKPRALAVRLGSSQAKPLDFRLFVAPKDLDLLRAVKPPLDALVDFGWFGFIAKPLFLGLRYLYERWFHNYGWAIVVLTIFINLALFPLKLKSIRSAQEMQRIAPQVKAIQERYKQYKFNDPRKQRMNQEVMKLYSEHHINPLGGCLPMALQLPILYGFYNVLQLPIELRHAPWIGWIKDLSAPDTFHPWGIPVPILPTVMVISMFVLQKMTPMATADPSQQRMMMIMPIVFGIMFYSFASGLVLYFLTANLVQIAQQAFINRYIPAPQPLPVPRKAAEARE